MKRDHNKLAQKFAETVNLEEIFKKAPLKRLQSLIQVSLQMEDPGSEILKALKSMFVFCATEEQLKAGQQFIADNLCIDIENEGTFNSISQIIAIYIVENEVEIFQDAYDILQQLTNTIKLD